MMSYYAKLTGEDFSYTNILLFIKTINKCHVKVRVRTLTDMVA